MDAIEADATSTHELETRMSYIDRVPSWKEHPMHAQHNSIPGPFERATPTKYHGSEASLHGIPVNGHVRGSRR